MSIQLLLSRVSGAELAGGGCTVSTACTTLPVPGWLEELYCLDCLYNFSWAGLARGWLYCTDCLYNFCWAGLARRGCTCSLPLWRVHEIKCMYLASRTHGLFITWNIRFLAAFTQLLYTHIQIDITSYGAIPLFYSPCKFPVNFPSIPFYLLGNPPLAWSVPVHLDPRLLVNWPPPPHSKFPTPRGFPEPIVRLTKTTSRSRLPWSGTVLFRLCPTGEHWEMLFHHNHLSCMIKTWFVVFLNKNKYFKYKEILLYSNE